MFKSLFQPFMTFFDLLKLICMCVCIKIKNCFESTSLMDAIHSMFFLLVLQIFQICLGHLQWHGCRCGLENTLGPCDGGSKSTMMDLGIGVGANTKTNGVNGLMVPSIRLCRCFKTLHTACTSIDFKQAKTSLFCNTTLCEPSSFDVFVFNSLHVSYNLSFIKVSSWNFDSG